MKHEVIRCPKCGAEIKISEVLALDIETDIRQSYETKLESWKKAELEKERIRTAEKCEAGFNKKYEELRKGIQERDRTIAENKVREDSLGRREVELDSREKALAEKLKKEEKIIEERAKEKAQESIRLQIEDLNSQVKEKDERLKIAEQSELELRKKQRQLEDDKKAFELITQRRLDEERMKIEEDAKRESEEGHKLKDAEKDKQLTDMRAQIEELKRKAEQGSQKIQGEVMELELEKLLRTEFPFDEIEPVSSGVKGGDIVHIVKTQSGHVSGKILWESKRTKNWSDSWIQKLKDDQREEKADLAVLVSEVLPKGFHHFRQIETVWVADLPSAISLALALRVMLIQVEKTREIETGKEEKMEVVYNYLTGTEFKNRVQAIVEAFLALKRDLDAERRAMESIWSKRDKQIEKVVLNIAGMRGDLEGIVGPSLPSIKLLELPQPDE